jgi:hypothetical protein
MRKSAARQIVRLTLGGPEDRRDSWRAVVPALGIPSAVALAIPAIPVWVRLVLVGAIVLGTLLGLLLRPRPRTRAKRWVTVEPGRITRTDEHGETVLATFEAPFGLTVLSDRARTRALLAFTTPAQTRYIPVRIDGPEEAARARELLARASTVSDGDVAPASGDADALSAAGALRLVQLVAQRSPAALERVFLTDPRGNAVVLDGAELRLGERVVDLTAPLEWRGFMFHESLGHLTLLYQATWLRQSAVEIVLVASMPSEITSWMVGKPGRAIGALTRDTLVQRALVRDLRLMEALPDVPPPRDQRVAIERLFMLPLRQALDRAPRAARTSTPPSSRARPEGRA